MVWLEHIDPCARCPLRTLALAHVIPCARCPLRTLLAHQSPPPELYPSLLVSGSGRAISLRPTRTDPRTCAKKNQQGERSERQKKGRARDQHERTHEHAPKTSRGRTQRARNQKSKERETRADPRTLHTVQQITSHLGTLKSVPEKRRFGSSSARTCAAPPPP